MRKGMHREMPGVDPRRSARAFTLLEVLAASAVLAIALMGILNISATGMKTARALQRTHVDAGTLAAWLSMTNRLEEGVESGDFRPFLGDVAPDATWVQEIRQINTNGLFQVDYTINYRLDQKPLQSRMSIILFRPDSINRLGVR
jgi:prepilin-type N-terminal cleavage/methylation domain-containing protein